MKTTLFCSIVMATVHLCASQVVNDAVKYDPRMAESKSVITDDVKWIDGRYLPIEGGFYDEDLGRYERVPGEITTNVNRGVRGQRKHTSGMMFRFKTDSSKLHFKWSVVSKALSMDHMPATGVSGIDVYRWDEGRRRWMYVKTGRIYTPMTGRMTINWKPGDKCLVNLPLYNGLVSFKLGIDKGAGVESAGVRSSGIQKPVVFYGTSITHGGCASRPGLGFVNITGRRLDVPVYGLGFSGSGVMELEMADVISRIDASCYVLDCVWNMRFDPSGKNMRSVQRNYEPFIRKLRAIRPGVPIVMAAGCDVFVGEGENSGNIARKNDFVRKLYDRLVAEGWKDIYFLPGDEMLGDDMEGTVDGVHPNDIGMLRMSEFYARAVAEALGLSKK